ncbi:IclR family transcriptional regulator [Klugiella xanthotipulae]|uniref:IclR family transcriptional regulator n=2 Tax=Klugiella xanthotipulae TaxID=244735 RepID=A0A543HYS2_9MICO|nr:IclR family transcriptional regulator [Klugiella xanthotipulae]
MVTHSEPQRDTSSHAQTLSRGIVAIEILAASPHPLSIDELAAELGVHRSVAYRILRTLEDHGIVQRSESGLLALGPRLATLARGVYRDLQTAALPELTAITQDLGMTAFIAVLDRAECITLTSVEPQQTHATVAQRPGTKHSLAVGAPGLAIQSILGADATARLTDARSPAELQEIRTRGYATSHNEVIAGLHSVAVPLSIPAHSPGALAVVYVATTHDDQEIGTRLAASVPRIINALR